jgi:hypothetical protein
MRLQVKIICYAARVELAKLAIHWELMEIAVKRAVMADK